MSWPSIKDLAKGTLENKYSAVSNVKKALELIESNKDYNFIISINKEAALKKAEQIDEDIKNGKNPGRLAGVPYIAKDNFLTYDLNTTAASHMLENFKAPYQATAINLLDDEGAIMIAKSNLDAFAHGSSTENSDFLVTKNPHDEKRIAGGSSGGSAAAIALDVVPFALGSDTGGSIRMPASICGVVGYKPTYGSVSRSGVVAMASSLDTIGVFTNKSEDAALVMEVLTKNDPLDSTTIEIKDNKYSEDIDTLPRKIGVIKEYMEGNVDEDIKKGINDVIDKLKNKGHEIEAVSIADLPLSLAVYYIVCPAEVASNLSRYDGIRYGYHDDNTTNLEEYYLKSRSNGFGAEAKRRIMIGTHVLSSGYFEAYYNKAQTVRSKLIAQFNDAFSKYDFLIGPTTPNVASLIGEHEDPISMYLMDILTVAVNLVGIPAISLPAGKIDNLPYGIQIMAPQGMDHSIFSLAKEIEGL